MTGANLADFTKNLSGRYVWHGQNDIELQCEQAFFGTRGMATIVAPSGNSLHFQVVEAGTAGRWLKNPDKIALKPGTRMRFEGPNWPNNTRIFGAELLLPEKGKEGKADIPIISDIGDAFQGATDEYGWILPVIIILIILGILMMMYLKVKR